MSLTCQHPQKNENNEDQLIHSAFFCGCWPRVTGKCKKDRANNNRMIKIRNYVLSKLS